MAGAGLGPSAIPTLLVTGDNRAGLCEAMARGLADAGINIAFVVAQAVGRQFSAVFGFESEADAARATTLLKKAAGRRR
jgi:predicted amino acid-binding ACT domain protein